MKFLQPRRLMSFLLLAAMLSTVACGGGSASNDDTTDGGTTRPEETTEPRIDNLPDDLDFGGQEVKAMYWADVGEYVEEQNGEVVNDAKYDRQRAVEKELNITFTPVPVSYSWDTRDEYVGMIRNAVMAGENAYDIVSGQYAVMPTLVSDGVLLDMNKLPHFDFDQPWWVKGLEEIEVNGKLYLASGEISSANTNAIECLLFNKKLASEYKLDDIYDVVKAGDWTYERFLTALENTYRDLNGNTTEDIESDQFGLIIPGIIYAAVYADASDVHVTEMVDGYPELVYGSERAITVNERVRALIHTNPNVYFNGGPTGDEWTHIANSFSGDRALFYAGSIADAKGYSDMETDFGLIPYPKYDDTQENYYSRVGETNTLFGIPKTCADSEVAAATMEALAIENYYTVSPALFEVAFKVKYARDEETVQMFEIIRNSVVFEFGKVFMTATNDIYLQYRANLSNNQGWASACESAMRSAKIQVDKFFKNVGALEE